MTEPLAPERVVVLVVEDHDDLRELCRVNLHIAGFDVMEAADAATALELASHSKPASIVLDLTLPDLDGWELLAKLRQEYGMSATPVVVVTARPAASEQPRAEAEGIWAFLSKPYDPAALVAAVFGAVSSAR